MKADPMYLTLNDGRKLGIEVSKNADLVYISHAHSDHARGGNIFSSDQTFDLISAGSEKRTSLVKLEDENVKLFPAGHILGSTQLRFTSGHTVVHTGDMKLRDGFTTEKAEILPCDELHIDCTFGHPDFNFPEKGEIADRIDRWTRTRLMTGQNVIFGAYSTGKAQELIHILNNFSDAIPVVDHTIEQKCKVYDKHGVKLKRFEIGTCEAAEAMRGKFVYIVPFHLVNQQSERWFLTEYKRVSFALVTGWANRYRYRNQAFPLSDHAGFSEILRYVEGSGAKEVVCHYGYASVMSSFLKSKGYNAKTDKEWETPLTSAVYQSKLTEPMSVVAKA